jgi:hypothetical protein
MAKGKLRFREIVEPVLAQQLIQPLIANAPLRHA